MVDAVFRDVRFAFRTIRMAPGVSTVSVLMLALGIAATAVAFSLIDAVLLKPLRYPEPDRLYVIHEILPQLKSPVVGVNALHYREWRKSTPAFAENAAGR